MPCDSLPERRAEPPGLRARLAPLGVVACCFLYNLVGRGVGDTYMVFLLPLGQEFGWQRSQMTSVYSGMMVVNGLAAPLAGWIFERFGPRALYGLGVTLMGLGHFLAGQLHALWQFYLCVSLLGGLGASALGMVPASALISRWFDRRLSTAIGLAYAGFGCGSLLMVPLAQTLIDTVGWRSAYGLIGSGVLAVALPTLFLPWKAVCAGAPGHRSAGMPPGPGGPGLPALAQARARVSAAVRSRPFWQLLQVMFFTGVGIYLVTVQSVAYFVELGFTPLQAASAFGTTAMLSIFGITSAGWLSDRLGYRRAATLSFAGSLTGVCVLMLLSWYPAALLLSTYVVVFGLCQGARGPITASLSSRLFPGPGLASVFGLVYACTSIGSGLGALLSGVLHDLTGGYRWNFAVSVLCLLVAVAPFWTRHGLQPKRVTPEVPLPP